MAAGTAYTMNRTTVIIAVVIIVAIIVYFAWWKPKKDKEDAAAKIKKEIDLMSNGNTGINGGANETGSGEVVGATAVEIKTKQLEKSLENAKTLAAKVDAKQALDEFTKSIRTNASGQLVAAV